MLIHFQSVILHLLSALINSISFPTTVKLSVLIDLFNVKTLLSSCYHSADPVLTVQVCTLMFKVSIGRLDICSNYMRLVVYWGHWTLTYRRNCPFFMLIQFALMAMEHVMGVSSYRYEMHCYSALFWLKVWSWVVSAVGTDASVRRIDSDWQDALRTAASVQSRNH